jgi:hypothetical protein
MDAGMSPIHRRPTAHGDQASHEKNFKFALKQGAESQLANNGKHRSASFVKKPD